MFVLILLLLYPNFTTNKENYNNILNPIEVFAQSQSQSSISQPDYNTAPPVVKSSKIINFNGVNYANVLKSTYINLNNFTVSAWFNTNMNVIGRDIAFLINKGGFGTERPGFNLNYGIWLNNREQISVGFETLNGDDYFLTSKRSYADGLWHNTIFTYDKTQNILNLYVDGIDTASTKTNIAVTPDNTGKQPIRFGANSFTDNGIINGNYTGQLDDIQVWNYPFTKEQVISLFDKECKIER